MISNLFEENAAWVYVNGYTWVDLRSKVVSDVVNGGDNVHLESHLICMYRCTDVPCMTDPLLISLSPVCILYTRKGVNMVIYLDLT